MTTFGMVQRMKQKTKFRKISSILSTVLLIAVILLLVVIFITRLTGHVPSIFGYSVFRVQTDSMTPFLQVGDVIIDKRFPPRRSKRAISSPMTVYRAIWRVRPSLTESSPIPKAETEPIISGRRATERAPRWMISSAMIRLKASSSISCRG